MVLIGSTASIDENGMLHNGEIIDDEGSGASLNGDPSSILEGYLNVVEGEYE